MSECLNEACQLSFNSISVDGDTSTNDSVFLLASASADNIGIDRAEDPKLSDFRAKLRDVMQDLAIQIVRDGEGASKLVTIDIAGADNELNARKIGLSIANSPLVKQLSSEDLIGVEL